jgi:phosphoglycerate dehydrogenase-like enzyme
MSMHVHITRPGDPPFLDVLESELDGVCTFSTGMDVPDPARYEVLVGGRPTKDHLTRAKQLRTWIIPFAGLPPGTRELLAEAPHVALHNLHHNARAAAEHAMALMIAASKSILPCDRSLRDGDWTPRYELARSMLLEDRTVLILGYGAIGRCLAPMCHGFGMRVIATRRSLDAATEQDGAVVHPAAALDELLPVADVVVVALPQTPDTTGLLDHRAFEMMKSSAILVNVGRGGIIDQHALHDALANGTIRAAGIDAWYSYPKDEPSRTSTRPGEPPFEQLENLVMSPHRAGHVEEIEMLRARDLAHSLRAAAEGRPIPHPVDPDRGY